MEEKTMNPKAINVEARKKVSQAKLDARRFFLKEKGLSDEAVRQDVTIRKIKADVRKSDFQLAAIAAQEEVRRRVEQAKAEKLAAAKTPAEKEAPEEIPVKKEKKEKKAKKERSEKQAQSEGKKEKPEKKAEQSEA
jgi:hypothetical protein